jgi:hypothetical protein
MPALYVNLMPKDQDLGYQRSSRPEQPDQRRPNKAARFPHGTEALRDSAPAVSLIRFTTGTGEISDVEYQPGDTKHHTYGPGEFLIHDLENTGDTALVFTTVEFKESANHPLQLNLTE